MLVTIGRRFRGRYAAVTDVSTGPASARGEVSAGFGDAGTASTRDEPSADLGDAGPDFRTARHCR